MFSQLPLTYVAVTPPGEEGSFIHCRYSNGALIAPGRTPRCYPNPEEAERMALQCAMLVGHITTLRLELEEAEDRLLSLLYQPGPETSLSPDPMV